MLSQKSLIGWLTLESRVLEYELDDLIPYPPVEAMDFGRN